MADTDPPLAWTAPDAADELRRRYPAGDLADTPYRIPAPRPFVQPRVYFDWAAWPMRLTWLEDEPDEHTRRR